MGVRMVIAELVTKLVMDDKQFKDTAGNAKKSSNDLFQSFKAGAAVLASVTAAFAVAKKAFDLAREGAAIDAVRGKFDNWATSIGTVSDTLLNDLRRATRGMYTDAELMASATDFMSLGLAKTHDQVVRLSKVSGALNMNMNQLVLTLTNKTTMRFDALGVKVDGFKEKVTNLQKTMGDDAFTEAFLQQAEAQIRITGEAADTAAGQYQKFVVAQKNATDNMKIGLAQGLLPAVEWWNKEIDAQNRAAEALRATNSPLLHQFNMTKAITPEIQKLTDEYIRWTEYGYAWRDALGAQSAAVVDLTTQVTNYGMKNEEIVGIVKQVADENKRYASVTEELRTAQINLLAEKLKLLDEGYKPESEAIQEVNKKMSDNAAKMDENKKKHKDWVNAKIGDLMLMKLSVDGLTNSEMAYYLAFMAHSGQLTAADAQMTMDMIAGADKRVAALEDEHLILDQVTIDVRQLMSRYHDAWVQSLVPIEYSYTITGRGAFPNVPTSGAAINLINQGVPPSVAINVAPSGSGWDNRNTGGGGRASGGPVIAGQSYSVAEFYRPEVFTPRESGRVDPMTTARSRDVRISNWGDFNYAELASQVIKGINNA